MVSLAALVACQHCPQKSYWQLQRHSLIRTQNNDLDNSFVDELCHFAKSADIFKDDEPRNISTELFLYKLIIDEGVQGIFSRCCDRAKNVLSFDGHQL